jgi:hypothetical protein
VAAHFGPSSASRRATDSARAADAREVRMRRHAKGAAVGVTVVIVAVEEEAVEGCAGGGVPAAGQRENETDKQFKSAFFSKLRGGARAHCC